MKKLRQIAKPICHLLVFGLLTLSLYTPAAHAGMVGTETVVNVAQTQQNRERLHRMLDRDDVKAQLAAHGVAPAQVQARVDSLTDEEVQILAARMDQLPAGGHDFLGILVFLFLLLLITDILGLTNVFPFVKHPER